MRTLVIVVSLQLLAGCSEDTKTPASPVQPVGPTAADSTRTAVFADTSLEAAVREALKNPAGPLNQEELLSLTQLVARGRGIRILTGSSNSKA